MRLHSELRRGRAHAEGPALRRYLHGLAREFTASPEFETKLSASTQREYKHMLTKAEPVFGDMPREALDEPAVRRDFLDWRAKVARTSGEREADNRLSVISAMLTWGQENGRIDANHIRGFKRLYDIAAACIAAWKAGRTGMMNASFS